MSTKVFTNISSKKVKKYNPNKTIINLKIHHWIKIKFAIVKCIKKDLKYTPCRPELIKSVQIIRWYAYVERQLKVNIKIVLSTQPIVFS